VKERRLYKIAHAGRLIKRVMVLAGSTAGIVFNEHTDQERHAVPARMPVRARGEPRPGRQDARRIAGDSAFRQQCAFPATPMSVNRVKFGNAGRRAGRAAA
jgi:hypothetical protein